MSMPTFQIPPVGPVMGKCWGRTMLGFAWNSVEAHPIQAQPGFRCSRHFHASKWNRFIVLQGKLIVRIFRDNEVDETEIGPWQVTDVPPGVEHEFQALEPTLAVEFYWVEIDSHDISRQIEGGPIE